MNRLFLLFALFNLTISNLTFLACDPEESLDGGVEDILDDPSIGSEVEEGIESGLNGSDTLDDEPEEVDDRINEIEENPPTEESDLEEEPLQQDENSMDNMTFSDFSNPANQCGPEYCTDFITDDILYYNGFGNSYGHLSMKYVGERPFILTSVDRWIEQELNAPPMSRTNLNDMSRNGDISLGFIYENNEFQSGDMLTLPVSVLTPTWNQYTENPGEPQAVSYAISIRGETEEGDPVEFQVTYHARLQSYVSYICALAADFGYEYDEAQCEAAEAVVARENAIQKVEFRVVNDESDDRCGEVDCDTLNHPNLIGPHDGQILVNLSYTGTESFTLSSLSDEPERCDLINFDQPHGEAFTPGMQLVPGDAIYFCVDATSPSGPSVENRTQYFSMRGVSESGEAVFLDMNYAVYTTPWETFICPDYGLDYGKDCCYAETIDDVFDIHDYMGVDVCNEDEVRCEANAGDWDVDDLCCFEPSEETWHFEGNVCQAIDSCANGVLDSGEIRVDCGGPCSGCDAETLVSIEVSTNDLPFDQNIIARQNEVVCAKAVSTASVDLWVEPYGHARLDSDTSCAVVCQASSSSDDVMLVSLTSNKLTSRDDFIDLEIQVGVEERISLVCGD